MTAPQRDAAMKLLATVLSPMGLEKVNEIRQADDDFKAHGSKRGRIAALAGVCALATGSAALAHRIDEYLRATILSLEPDRVQASMRLIPGILAPLVIASVDADGDGSFSPREERAYAQHVLDDLAITIDGRTVRPKLISWSFPRPAQLRDGLGEIHIDHAADPPCGGQNRSLILANHHLSRISVYLMNVLDPQGDGIRILEQKRNEQQSL